VLGAESVNEVFLYSDSVEMRAEGTRYGATAVLRPPEVSLATTTTEATVQRFIQDRGINNAVMVVQVTTPFLKSRYVDMAIKKWQSGHYDSIVSVAVNQRFLGNYNSTPYEFLPQWPKRAMRQDLTKDACRWLETGAFYLAKKGLWLMGQRIGSKCGVVVHHDWEAIEVDEEIDLQICNAVAPIIEDL